MFFSCSPLGKIMTAVLIFVIFLTVFAAGSAWAGTIASLLMTHSDTTGLCSGADGDASRRRVQELSGDAVIPGLSGHQVNVDMIAALSAEKVHQKGSLCRLLPAALCEKSGMSSLWHASSGSGTGFQGIIKSHGFINHDFLPVVWRTRKCEA